MRCNSVSVIDMSNLYNPFNFQSNDNWDTNGLYWYNEFYTKKLVWTSLNQFHRPQKTGPRWSGSVPTISGSVLDWLRFTVACFGGKKTGLNQTCEHYKDSPEAQLTTYSLIPEVRNFLATLAMHRDSMRRAIVKAQDEQALQYNKNQRSNQISGKGIGYSWTCILWTGLMRKGMESSWNNVG